MLLPVGVSLMGCDIGSGEPLVFASVPGELDALVLSCIRKINSVGT